MLLKIKSKDCGRLNSEHFSVMRDKLIIAKGSTEGMCKLVSENSELQVITRDGQEYISITNLQDLQAFLSIPGLSFTVEVQNG